MAAIQSKDIRRMKLLHDFLPIDLLSRLRIDQYPEGFFHWLQLNSHIWEQFERYALTMAAKRNRYSARTIIEVMRWDSDLRNRVAKPHPVSGVLIPPPLFKLSNNMTPGLARLWMAKHGNRNLKFFQINQ